MALPSTAKVATPPLIPTSIASPLARRRQPDRVTIDGILPLYGWHCVCAQLPQHNQQVEIQHPPVYAFPHFGRCFEPNRGGLHELREERVGNHLGWRFARPVARELSRMRHQTIALTRASVFHPGDHMRAYLGGCRGC